MKLGLGVERTAGGSLRAAAALGSLVVLLGCARAASPASAPSSSLPEPSTVPPAPPGESPAVPSTRETVEPQGAPPQELAALPLPLRGFYANLQELEQGQSRHSVRIAWFGDSHTAADFWSDPVRVALQDRFGNGGPGMVQVGVRRYRHGRARVRVRGRWQIVPPVPAGAHPPEGVFFGLFGMGAVPLSPDASAQVWLPSARDRDVPLSWSLYYRLPDRTSGFQVKAGTGPFVLARGELGASPTELSVARVRSAEGQAHFEVSHLRGRPELFGVAVENEQADGVVLDTFGINGARAVTALGWPAQAWIAALREREPSLVILAYGTNEVGDGRPAAEYAPQFAEIIERVRSAAPQADCLLIGPTDRAQANWRSFPKVTEIDEVQRGVARELGCAYFSPFQTMGGAGGIRSWAFRKHPLARKDRVHLTAAGYRRLAKALANELLASYDLAYPSDARQ